MAKYIVDKARAEKEGIIVSAKVCACVNADKCARGGVRRRLKGAPVIVSQE